MWNSLVHQVVYHTDWSSLTTSGISDLLIQMVLVRCLRYNLKFSFAP